MKEGAASFSSSGWRVSTAHFISRILRNISIKGAGWLRQNLTHWVAGSPQHPVVTSVEGGIQLLLHPKLDKGLESILYYHGSYELGTLDLISKCLKPGDTFIDVGANIGLFSIYLSKNCPGINICAFEPLESTFTILEQNIEINQCANIKTFPYALGITNDTGKITENLELSRGSASMVGAETSGRYEQMVHVQTLNDFVVKEGVDNIGLLKIDVEGWEQQVLLGAGDLLGKRDAPIWVVEHNNTQKTEGAIPEEVYEYILATNEYTAFKSKGGKQLLSPLVPISSISELPINDNIFYLLPSHVEALPKAMFQP
ncbi:MAG TPA: FkbM family methyltransferase [Flavobacteriales bacterium]|nr:FkbM family methyltransferase [Flavobacteriales bacterium]